MRSGRSFLQRQNEPSLAVSSRNPCHLLAGANDYRAVDVEDAAGEVGDAWLGVFKSFDCGATWTSTLLPGYPGRLPGRDGFAAQGLAAGADATVRAGTSMFYMSGIAFTAATTNWARFVSRFVDNNNAEAADPITLGTFVVDSGTSGQFLDKSWIAPTLHAARRRLVDADDPPGKIRSPSRAARTTRSDHVQQVD
jgi:hypothetical protein